MKEDISAGIATLSIHAADDLNRVPDVAPPINVSTTYKYHDDPDKNLKASETVEGSSDRVIYSRLSHPNSLMAEELIGSITKSHAVIYNGGVAAFFALMTHVNPKRLFIDRAYHGCHAAADILTRNYGLKQLGLSETDLEQLQEGDLVHIETPINPEASCVDIQHYADKAHAKGALLSVDSTFAPLQNPFEFGADLVMHSATKYFGGHSDLLAGLLLTQSEDVKAQLLLDRNYLGTNIGNLEASLLIRSLRTFELRVRRQADNATTIVKYLNDNKDKLPKLEKVLHSSLQNDAFVEKQLKGIHSPTFSILVKSEAVAKNLPGRLKFFYHATSLGGVESLIEWRCLSDETAPETLLRVSVGVENVQDLIDDLTQALSMD